MCSACVRGRGLSLGHHKVDAKTKEAEQIPTVSVNYGFFWQPEDRAHDTLPSAHRAGSQEYRNLESPSTVKGCGASVPCKGSDG